MRTSSIALLTVTGIAAAISVVACSSSGGGSGTPTPVVSGTPFNPTGCQVVWLKRDPPSQTRVIDYYVIDAPVGRWVSGTNGYYVGDPTGVTNVTGAFVYHYDLVTSSSAAAAVASSGQFAVGTDPTAPTKIGNPVNVQDTIPNPYYLDSAGTLTTYEGSSGVGNFLGTWSDPGSPDVVPGSGTMSILFAGSSFTLGADLSYGLCYVQTPFAQETAAERVADAGRRAARALGF